MSLLILGLLLFLGTHLFTTQRGLRTSLRERFGENGYKIGYTVLSLVGLVLVVNGYGDYRVTIGGVYGDGVPPRAGLHMLGWEQGSRSLRWEHALLPEGDESRDRTHMVVDEDTVNYSYQTNHTPKLGPHRLVAWSIMTGEQRWKATLPESAEGSMVTYLGLGSGHLFLQLDQHLLIIDTKSGAVQKDLDNL